LDCRNTMDKSFGIITQPKSFRITVYRLSGQTVVSLRKHRWSTPAKFFTDPRHIWLLTVSGCFWGPESRTMAIEGNERGHVEKGSVKN
jgi:hypothetical protein